VTDRRTNRQMYKITTTAYSLYRTECGATASVASLGKNYFRLMNSISGPDPTSKILFKPALYQGIPSPFTGFKGHVCTSLIFVVAKESLKLLLVSILTSYFDFPHPVSYWKVHFTLDVSLYALRHFLCSSPCIKQLQAASPILIIGQKIS